MNRPIKFRAWDKRLKVWFDAAVGDAANILVWRGEGSNVTARPIDYFNIVQFTGLHDMHGKEIYEGDIVKPGLYEHKKLLKKILVVEWLNDAAGFSPYCLFTLEAKETEIIGNIYENSELVEKE